MTSPAARPTGTKDWAEFKPLAGSGITLLNAHFTEHRFERHSHATYSVGLTRSGVQTFGCRGTRHACQPGDVMLFNPDEPHDGSRGTDAGFGYSILYVDPAQVLSWLDRDAGTPGAAFFRAPSVHDPAGASLLLQAVDALQERHESLRAEELASAAFVTLLTRHGERRSEPTPAVDPGRLRLQRAREYLDACFAEDITVTTLAAETGLSRAHLSRAFAATFGQPPHAYLTAVRLRHAQAALLRGERLADAALAAGFADQAHFNRRFKGGMGISPGVWQRQMLGARRDPKPDRSARAC